MYGLSPCILFHALQDKDFDGHNESHRRGTGGTAFTVGKKKSRPSSLFNVPTLFNPGFAAAKPFPQKSKILGTKTEAWRVRSGAVKSERIVRNLNGRRNACP